MGRGSSKSGVGRTVAQDKAIKKLVRQTRDLKNEQYRIIDDNGNVLIKSKGDSGSVGTTAGEKRQYLDGNISLHNHPDGGTFSDADFRDFGFGAKEIVVAAPEGTYRLINTKMGTKQQYDGWVDMRDQVRQINDKQADISSMALRNQARANLANHPAKKSMDGITNQYNKIFQKDGKDAAGRYARRTKDRYDKYSKQYQDAVRTEERRLTVQPYHDFYTKNASRYGFKYVFEKR